MIPPKIDEATDKLVVQHMQRKHPDLTEGHLLYHPTTLLSCLVCFDLHKELTEKTEEAPHPPRSDSSPSDGR